MKKEVATQIVVLGIEMSSSLSKILAFAKENCDETELDALHGGIVQISANIFQFIVRPQLIAFPELEIEIDKIMSK